MRITLDTNQLLRALMRPPELATFIPDVVPICRAPDDDIVNI